MRCGCEGAGLGELVLEVRRPQAAAAVLRQDADDHRGRAVVARRPDGRVADQHVTVVRERQAVAGRTLGHLVGAQRRGRDDRVVDRAPLLEEVGRGRDDAQRHALDTRPFSPQQNGATSGRCPTYRGRMGEVLPLQRPDREPAREAPARTAEPLWRELVGRELRTERQERGERLTDVAERAGVSTQYLSEVERGLKDPSSEILSAVAGALDLTVRQLSVRVGPQPRAVRRPLPRRLTRRTCRGSPWNSACARLATPESQIRRSTGEIFTS